MSGDTPSPGASTAASLLQEALGHHGAGRMTEAAELYSRVLKAEPENPDALHLYGALRYQEGALEEALSLVDRAIALMPEAADYHNTRGLVLRGLERLDEAESALERALEIAPDHGEARANLGAALTRRADRLLEEEAHKEAQALCRRVVELTPDNATAHNNLGKALTAAGKDGDAVAAFDRAAGLDSSFAAAHYNLGTLLQKRGESQRAVTVLGRAVEIDPDYAEAWSNLGQAWQSLGRHEEAMAAFNRAIELNPECADTHANLALLFLLTGNLEEGWAEHEWRWRKTSMQQRPFPQPPWDGTPLDGKTILLWGEQGVGDQLMFAGQIADLQAQGAAVILEADPRLAPLFARSFPHIEVVAKADPPDAQLLSDGIDFQVPLGGLARYLRADAKSFPQHEGYLKADPDQTQALRERYKGDGGNLLVGISWGSTDPKRPEKALALGGWKPLLEEPGVTLVDLQYGDTADERAALASETGMEILHDGEIDPLSDLDGFAAQVAAMDVTVSICNSTIFMAGALGVPGRVLVPFAPGWIWGLDREDNPWFPSLRLIRQEKRGDWAGVMERVAQELARRVAAS
ncbi:MAG: tetratricopeptide repeat protein [Alphaproteobacteria bacterium]|nr:tetratricopeptide repeat protein [Alphaproteobacteria bacterium]